MDTIGSSNSSALNSDRNYISFKYHFYYRINNLTASNTFCFHQTAAVQRLLCVQCQNRKRKPLYRPQKCILISTDEKKYVASHFDDIISRSRMQLARTILQRIRQRSREFSYAWLSINSADTSRILFVVVIVLWTRRSASTGALSCNIVNHSTPGMNTIQRRNRTTALNGNKAIDDRRLCPRVCN